MPAVTERVLGATLSAARGIVDRQPDSGTGIFATQDLAWVREFEAAAPAIREEYQALLDAGRDLVPLERFMGHSQGQDGDWHMYGFVFHGHWHTPAERECPRTAAALRRLPGLQSAFFSVAGTDFHLPPHLGWNPGVLRLHLGVSVAGEPGDVWIRCGDDVDYWVDGKAILFDDNLEHEVMNRSGAPRVVLFCEIRRPLPPGPALANRVFQVATGFHPQVRGAGQRYAELDAALA